MYKAIDVIFRFITHSLSDFCRLYSTQNARWLRTRASPATGTAKKIQIPFFDAERFARLLEKEGFSAAQARTVIHALDDVVDERYAKWA